MNLNELEVLAKAATPGPWYADKPNLFPRFMVADCGPLGKVYMKDQQPSHGTTSMDDATFIAAANPQAVLALIALCRQQHEALKKYQNRQSMDDLEYAGYAGDSALAAYEEFNK